MNIARQYKLAEEMRQYILPVLIALNGDQCADCKEQYNSYDIDHLRYGEDITVYDLQLLCYDCHRSKTINSGEAYLSQTTHCSTCTCY